MHPVLTLCLNNGILTGSQAFQVSTEDSDWDIVITRSKIPPELYSYNYEICATWDDNSEPCDADGIDNIGQMYKGVIWGPIDEISKFYIYDEDDEFLTIINLFIYPDKEQTTVQKFHLVNAQMMFTLTHEQRKHRPTRIAKFVEILKKLKIT